MIYESMEVLFCFLLELLESFNFHFQAITLLTLTGQVGPLAASNGFRSPLILLFINF